MKFLVATFLIALSIIASIDSKGRKYVTDVYPSAVQRYSIRKDATTGRPVRSGLMHTLKNKSTLVEFRKHLQCATKDSNLNFNNGMISKLRLAPPTVDTYKAFCSAVEDKRFGEWSAVNEAIKTYSKGKYTKNSEFNRLGPYSRPELLRVIKGELYVDWPWGTERFSTTCNDNMFTLLINITLNRISDMPDSAFFAGAVDPTLPADIVVPYFAFCTAEQFAELVFPWIDMWKIVLQDYFDFRAKGLPFNNEGYRRMTPGYRTWKDKLPKAAVFGTMMKHRQIIFDVARLHPNYIDAGALDNDYCLPPWNPSSSEYSCEGWQETRPGPRPNASVVDASQHLPAGYVLPLYKLLRAEIPYSYQPAAYKYVIVPLGQQLSISTSARIAHLLSFSGAVVLLQRSVWRYHFSAQFKPWVHYVPITFTGADLVEKIQWLQDHDDLARQIARNGRNFARSYLRLEDFYCSVAGTLEVMAEVSKEVAVVAAPPFNASKVLIQCNPGQHILYEYPK